MGIRLLLLVLALERILPKENWWRLLGGTAFELTPTVGGVWTETVLYSFGYEAGSWAGLIFDSAGNLYGTTWYGGTNQCGQTMWDGIRADTGLSVCEM